MKEARQKKECIQKDSIYIRLKNGIQFIDRKQTRLETGGGEEEWDGGKNYKGTPGNFCG